MFQAILDMIYPVRCPICEKIVTPKGERICTSCKEKLNYIREPRCFRCSKPIEQEEQEYCSDCQRGPHHFDQGYAVWVYDEAMKHSVAGYKYRGKKEYAKFYTEEILRGYGNWVSKLAPDALVPVPIHRSKYSERGYNQADILARGIGKELEIPVLSDLLIRNRKTLPQKMLSDKERFRNLKAAFAMNKKRVSSIPKQLSRVLLVDDIYTTGSTIEACAQVLKSHGIKEVYFIVLCIGKGF